ncbi:bestrophin family protein [Halpernia frigidisoli]|uniref:Putative membrane protein n=1 Tax=Halpernia frigidisoli TaxID=1125876 RepID=A0A1I3GMX1_9FLAO|nr:bestrophin family ion channel [Halpernia frigidisoli]SFI24817.1 putative membrane protein [Halpernia frigidisoli]
MLIKTKIYNQILTQTWKVDLIMIFSCAGAYFFHDQILDNNLDVPTIIPTVLGTAIAFFIGFNNNQAYDRWWEARKIWGEIVNDSRTFARDLLSYSKKSPETDHLIKQMILRHIDFLYALKHNLRDRMDKLQLPNLSENERQQVLRQSNVHNAILFNNTKALKNIYDKKLINDFEFLQIDAMLVKFSNEMGMSERIKNTIFPTTYSYLTKVFIWVFVLSFTFVISPFLSYYSIFVGWLVGFVFVSTQINGMNLVTPFKKHPTSIPISQITRTIEINLLQMLEENDIPEPTKPINKEYIL